MLQSLIDFYYNTVFNSLEIGDGFDLADFVFEIGGFSVNFRDYLTITCSLISMIIILVLCCLFVGKLIKVVARLFMGA